MNEPLCTWLEEEIGMKELAEQLELPEKGVAVAAGSKMIPRNEWAECTIADGDNIIVIRASCGG